MQIGDAEKTKTRIRQHLARSAAALTEDAAVPEPGTATTAE
jgi:hypothetical protein